MTQMRLTLEQPYCCEAEGESTLNRIVIGVESWVNHFQFKYIRPTVQWKHNGLHNQGVSNAVIGGQG
jgi:hypothetical protein